MSDEKEGRAPLLTTGEVAKKSGGLKEHERCLAQWVIDFYEAKITSGELITKEEHERLMGEQGDELRERLRYD